MNTNKDNNINNNDDYKFKYIKYKKKYIEFKKIYNNIKNITNKIIILPNEFEVLDGNKKNIFEVYELDNLSNPISYIKKDYKAKLDGGGEQFITESSSAKEEEYIMEKNIITPSEYFLLSDSNKSKYEINESDYGKFLNRVVPKNYKKIN